MVYAADLWRSECRHSLSSLHWMNSMQCILCTERTEHDTSKQTSSFWFSNFTVGWSRKVIRIAFTNIGVFMIRPERWFERVDFSNSRPDELRHRLSRSESGRPVWICWAALFNHAKWVSLAEGHRNPRCLPSSTGWVIKRLLFMRAPVCRPAIAGLIVQTC